MKKINIENLTSRMLIAAAILLLPSVAYSASVKNWEMRINAKTATEAENRLILGQLGGATDGFDGKYEVPAYVEGSISAYFPHPEWGEETSKYWRDIKGPEQEKSWTINVSSSISGTTITLSWKSRKLDGFTATLTDSATNEQIDMVTTDSYSYTNAGLREFTVSTVAPLNLPTGKPKTPQAKFQKFETGADVELQVGDGTDSEGYTLYYTVEVYSDRQMNELVAFATDLSNEGGELSWSIGELSNGVYFWRSQVYNGTFYSDWTGTKAFRVGQGNVKDDMALGGKSF